MPSASPTGRSSAPSPTTCAARPAAIRASSPSTRRGAWSISAACASPPSSAPCRRAPNSTVFYTGYQGWANSTWWHTLIDDGLRGEPVPELIDLDDGDGQPACWRNGSLFVYYDHLPRMAWHTPEYLAEQRRTLPEAEYLRVWENRRTSAQNALCTAAAWDALCDPALAPLQADDPRPLVFGVDAATQHDSTALVGCAWDAPTQSVHVVYSAIWTPNRGRPLSLWQSVGEALARLAGQCRIAAVYYDPYQLIALAEQLRERHQLPMIAFGQGAQRLQSDGHLRQLLSEGRLRHTGRADAAPAHPERRPATERARLPPDQGRGAHRCGGGAEHGGAGRSAIAGRRELRPHDQESVLFSVPLTDRDGGGG